MQKIVMEPGKAGFVEGKREENKSKGGEKEKRGGRIRF